MYVRHSTSSKIYESSFNHEHKFIPSQNCDGGVIYCLQPNIHLRFIRMRHAVTKNTNLKGNRSVNLSKEVAQITRKSLSLVASLTRIAMHFQACDLHFRTQTLPTAE